MNVVETGGSVTEEKRLGEVVQLARKSAGLTQQALCQKSGLSYSTLAKIERGAIKSPSVFTIQHIALTLGISLDQLLLGVPSHAATTPPSKLKKTSKSGVRFVYFDMNGCLIRFLSSAFNHLAADAGVTPDVVEAVFWGLNEDVNRGEKTIHQLNTALAERLQIMVDWNQYYLGAVEATPGMDELLQWTSENYGVGILTNTMPDLVTPLLASGKLPQINYNAIVESCIVHALKPEAKMYQIAAEMAGVEPHEILLVDDDKSNLSAAGKLGWHTMSFDALHPESSIVNVSTALQPAE